MAAVNPVDSSKMENTRRRILAATVGAVLQESGFHSAEKAAVGTLTEMLQSLLFEIGSSCRMNAEIAYRTEPVIADYILAMSEMGISLDGIQSYAKRPNRIVISTPGQQVEIKQFNVLQVGDRKNHLPHIPEHFPDFPDTHTYCFSHTYKQPVTEYEAIREKAAQQKRDIEKALTKYSSKTNDSQSLFLYDDREYALVALKYDPRPYIDSLMPRDQVFEEDDEYLAKIKEKRKEAENAEGGKETRDDQKEQEINNPYLKPVKLPRKRNKIMNSTNA